MKDTFWYKALIRDTRGVAVVKEGDVEANNLIHAMTTIERTNKNIWRGAMQSLQVFNMDFETGLVAQTPAMSWIRGYGTSGMKEVDPNEEKPHVPWSYDPSEVKDGHYKDLPAQSSPSVSFTGASIGWPWSKPHQSYREGVFKCRQNK